MALSKDSKNKVRKNNKKKISNYHMQEVYDEAKVASEFSRFKKVTLTTKQRELFDSINNNIITTITGPAGTSKTFSACFAAIEALRKGEIKKIYLVKPLETSGEETGFLPGDLDEKVKPFVQSFIDNLQEMVDGKDLQMMMTQKVIEFVPIAFMRGRTLKDSFILIDECQNSDIKQMMTMVTRLGQNSKIIFIGDQKQNDINKRYLAFNFFIETILGGLPETCHFQFSREDIVRHPLLIEITDRYEKAEAEGRLPDTKNRN